MTTLETTLGPVTTLTLSGPGKRNPLSPALLSAIVSACDDLRTREDVRVVVLRGAGGHFCAGGDIGDMAQARMKLAQQQAQLSAGEADTERNPIEAVNAAFGRLCLAYAHASLPIVTVLEGTVMGGGFGLACVSDVSLARDNVSFRLPETSLGIVPAQIAPFLVERLGYAEAKRLAVTGAKVDAQEALTIRLVHEVHADEDSLDAALQRTLARILSCGPKAIAHTKQLLARARHTSAEYLIDDAAAVFARAVLSEEGQEGTGAFMQKRAPNWMP